jgi:transposase
MDTNTLISGRIYASRAFDEIIDFVNKKRVVTEKDLRKEFPRIAIEKYIKAGLLIKCINHGGQYITTAYLVNENKDKYGTWKYGGSIVFHVTGTLADAIHFVLSMSDKPLTAMQISGMLGRVKIKSGLNELQHKEKLKRKKGEKKITIKKGIITAYFIFDDKETYTRQMDAWVNLVNEIAYKKKVRALVFRSNKFTNGRMKELYNSKIEMEVIEHLRKNPHLSHINEIVDVLNEKVCLFCWNDATGAGREQLLKFLEEGLKIDWVKNAKLKKTADNKQIILTNRENSITLNLNEAEDKVSIKTNEGNIYEYVSKVEEGKLNIYGKDQVIEFNRREIKHAMERLIEKDYMKKECVGKNHTYRLTVDPDDASPEYIKIIESVMKWVPKIRERKGVPTPLPAVVIDSIRNEVSKVLLTYGMRGDVSEEYLEDIAWEMSPLTTCIGRPQNQTQPMFRASILKWLLGISSWEILEERLKRNEKLVKICGFDTVPDASSFTIFWKEMGVASVEEVYIQQVKNLAKNGIVKGKIISMDSTLIVGLPDDFDAKWGFSTTKGWIFGYKIHMIVDAEQEIPLGFIITSGSKSDMGYFIPLIDKAHELGIDFKIVLADKGYDKKLHYQYAASKGRIPIIALNTRRGKLLKAAFHRDQTWLGKWIKGMDDDEEDPFDIFKRDPRINCRIPRNSDEWKKYYCMRVASERVFARLKMYLRGNMGFYGSGTISVHVTLICITMCAIAGVAHTSGVPELMRSTKWLGI